jgi:ferredoxin
VNDFVERKVGDVTIRIDRTRCIATSNCMNVAPEVFEYDDENISSFREHR